MVSTNKKKCPILIANLMIRSTEAVVHWCSVQYSQENTCVGVSF